MEQILLVQLYIHLNILLGLVTHNKISDHKNFVKIINIFFIFIYQ